MVFSQVMQTMVLKFVSVPSVAKGEKAKPGGKRTYLLVWVGPYGKNLCPWF